jgi:hypothetical protein
MFAKLITDGCYIFFLAYFPDERENFQEMFGIMSSLMFFLSKRFCVISKVFYTNKTHYYYELA